MLYAGEQYDETSGLYYLRARHYDGKTGRFTQEDTYLGDGRNLYAYVHSNPLNYVDPTGHTSVALKDENWNPADDFQDIAGGKVGQSSKADVLAQNRASGRAFEQQEFAKFSSQNNKAVEQITVKTPTGVKTRVDAIGVDANGNVVINEYKSSLAAPLTNNQKIAFPEIYGSGATVVGTGKGIFTGGYQIPSSTEVAIIRP